MPLDDLIEELQSLRSQYGNIPVIDDRDHPVNNVEFNDDDTPCIVIEFSRETLD